MSQEDDLFGLFQQFRPSGGGADRLFADVPNRDHYLSRLREVYRATSDPACANDAYFVIRSPCHSTDEELRVIGSAFVRELRALAEIIRNEELSQYLQRIEHVEVVAKLSLNRSNDDNLLVMEQIGDWLGRTGEYEDRVLRMREAYYSIACDFFLMYYLQWPSFDIGRDVFRPYFELWLRDANLSFDRRRLQIGRCDRARQGIN